ncbi:helix-turn-helix domain-containing protein [Pseudomonas chlororaphis]|uniref:helix-turn-helix domain-containing protein n=1 Tax=Pseudomonas chlororaphis TaxID=587753 RepID=UPI0030D397AC
MTMTLNDWCAEARLGEQILRIRTGCEALCLTHDESSVRWFLPPEWQGLLVLRPGLHVVGGDARLLPLSQINLIKLQLFIDRGADFTASAVRGEPWAALREDGVQDQKVAGLESWYLACALQGGKQYQAFAQQLRGSESYRLLGFLLEQGSSSEKLQDLALCYGVSVSHFRRLSRQAFGGCVKSGLREWRTAKALLSMAEGTGSLTDVAIEHGYASSSHFSKEIRELVGVAPSSLTDITRLLSE